MHAAAAPTALGRQPHHWPTVLAIAVVVYALAKLTHEAVGHGLACELAGGDLQAVSSSWAACEKAGMGIAGRRVIEAAGTAANLAVGLAALLLVRLRTFRSGPVYAFTWLTAAVHLLVGGGYLMVDPLFGFGDWGDFLAGLEPALAWRAGASAAGAAISLGTFFALRTPLERLLGGTQRQRAQQARLLCWLPYFAAGGVVLTGAAALNSLGAAYAFTSGLATLGGTFLLVWSPLAIERLESPAPRYAVESSLPWLVAGGCVLAFLLAAFGPGITL
jgi:hypothetical protein